MRMMVRVVRQVNKVGEGEGKGEGKGEDGRVVG